MNDSPSTEIETQARYIMETGKLIHDRVSRAFTGHTAGRKNKRFCELSAPQLHAVKAARIHGEMTLTEFSRRLGVSPPSASAMVDRLVEKGILLRKRSDEDRRKVVISISPEVIRDIEVIEENVLNAFMELVQKLGPDTTRKWCEVLAHIKMVLGAEDFMPDAGRKAI